MLKYKILKCCRKVLSVIEKVYLIGEILKEKLKSSSWYFNEISKYLIWNGLLIFKRRLIG